MTTPCGCRVGYAGIERNQDMVLYCHMHAHAEEMFEALKDVAAGGRVDLGTAIKNASAIVVKIEKGA